MNKPCRVVVTTSDRYLPILKPFSYLMNRYWVPNPEVVVGGFTPPDFSMPPNFHFVSIGRFEDYPFSKWSNAVIKLLGQIDDEVVCLLLEDYLISRPVDTRAVQILTDYMYQFRYVAKIDLFTDRLYAHGADLNYGHVAYLDLVKSMPGSPYHLSLMAGLWRREHLLRHMVPNESPHDVEMIGTTRLSHDQNVIVLGTRNCPLRHTLGLRSQDHTKLNLEGIDQADIDQMRSLGYLKPWEAK